MNGYELSRAYWNWAFENPEKVKPAHAAIYFFAIEHCNRLGWKEKFGFPTQMVMDAVGIRRHHTYMRYFNELVDWGFLQLVQASKNQHQALVISIESAMSKNRKAESKQSQSTGRINKPINTNNQETESYHELLSYLNKATGKNHRTISGKVMKAIRARMKEGATCDELKQAISNAAADDFHKGNGYKYLTLEYITRPDQFEKWLNAKPGDQSKKMVY